MSAHVSKDADRLAELWVEELLPIGHAELAAYAAELRLVCHDNRVRADHLETEDRLRGKLQGVQLAWDYTRGMKR